jgi:hypothetical protein
MAAPHHSTRTFRFPQLRGAYSLAHQLPPFNIYLNLPIALQSSYLSHHSTALLIYRTCHPFQSFISLQFGAPTVIDTTLAKTGNCCRTTLQIDIAPRSRLRESCDAVGTARTYQKKGIQKHPTASWSTSADMSAWQSHLP